MKKKYQIQIDQLNNSFNYVRPTVQSPPESFLRVKERYGKQFEQAMIDVKDRLNQASSLDDILRYLNEKAYKSRTGKPWTMAILRREIKKHNLSFFSKNKEDAKAYEAVKARYQDQYKDAVKLIEELHREEVKIKEIPDALEAQGYKTITGVKWTEATVRYALSKLRN